MVFLYLSALNIHIVLDVIYSPSNLPLFSHLIIFSHLSTEEAKQISISFILWYLACPFLLNPLVLGVGEACVRAGSGRNMLMLHKRDVALFSLFQKNFGGKVRVVEVEFYRGEEGDL